MNTLFWPTSVPDLKCNTQQDKLHESSPKLQSALVAPLEEMIEESPAFGHWTVVHLLGMNRNMVPRIFQLKG